MADYIEREAITEKSGWYNLINGKSIHGVQDYEIASVPSADVVPWSWLEQLVQGAYMSDMPAKNFIKYARKEWENGTTDKKI